MPEASISRSSIRVQAAHSMPACSTSGDVMRTRVERTARGLAAAVMVWAMLVGVAHAAENDLAQDKAAIRSVIGTTWDRPAAKVSIEPVVVDGGHAIAD